MKRIFQLLAGLVFSLALGLTGCTAGSPESTPTPGVPPLSGEATVNSIEILILESFPVQVTARLRGSLPNGCTRIQEIRQSREGNTFELSVVTAREGDACTEALVPFDENVSLDVLGLPAGTYLVNAGGARATFDLAMDNIMPTEPPVSGGTATVEQVSVAVKSGALVEVVVTASGTLPDGCASIQGVRQERRAGAIQVELEVVRPKDQMCAAILAPFEYQFALDVKGLRAGRHTVTVGGVPAEFVLDSDVP